ncbi:MAG TPA: fatty acid desaturase [Candidatus Obscuribacterales bacterium]
MSETQISPAQAGRIPGWTRQDSIRASRWLIVLLLAACLGSYFWQPVGLAWLADILLRGWLHFLSGSMAHEAAHGHLGNSKRANLWWGRIALLPAGVAYVAFQKTHLYHHSYTNDPEKDPDYYLHQRPAWLTPIRAFAMPYHWIAWLRQRGKLTRSILGEWALTYLAYFLIYTLLALVCGPVRVLAGLVGSAALHALVLWYFFAIKTHEGGSMGSPEERSHNYYGSLAYWLSCGLSLHRVHHLHPNLSWLEMAAHIPHAGFWQQLAFRRQIAPTMWEEIGARDEGKRKTKNEEILPFLPPHPSPLAPHPFLFPDN